MKIKKLIEEDFVNYKKPSMVLGFPHCTFKCDKECGQCVCQNSALAKAPVIEVDRKEIIKRYLNNPLTSAVVLQGLEPLDDYEQLTNFIQDFREKTNDDIVVYTGYKKEESVCQEFGRWLKNHNIHNIAIKFGRFIPNSKSRFDEVLGVTLASDNQMAVYIG